MGRTLQIRVLAYTYSEKEVETRWPSLFFLAFGRDALESSGGERGVLDLVHKIEDKYRFSDMQENIREVLSQPLKELKGKMQELEECLADRRPGEADRLSYVLEDILDGLEKEIAPMV